MAGRVRALGAMALWWVMGGALVSPARAAPPADADCLACHEDPSLKREDGRPVSVVPGPLAASVHGQAGLSCVDCHADLAKVTDFPHPNKLAPVECGSCHEEAGAEYGRSAHAEARRTTPGSPTASCTDCHGTHEVRSPKDPASATYHLNLPGTCGRCHGDPETIRRGHIAIGNVVAKYQDSIHGRALRESGLVVAPNCNTCHGHHDIRRAGDEKSPVFRSRIPRTCGTCHAGIEGRYGASVHGQAVRAGNAAGAVCTDCHSAHGIQAALPAWRLEVVKECGTCHEESLRTYRDGFHGQAGSLGFVRVATCADCHTAHDILPRRDPRSTVAPANLTTTCGRCHPGAGANFVKFDPHADPEDPQGSRVLYYTGRLMKLLLAAVFTFFGVHTALWFPRELRARRQAHGGSTPPAGKGPAAAAPAQGDEK